MRNLLTVLFGQVREEEHRGACLPMPLTGDIHRTEVPCPDPGSLLMNSERTQGKVRPPGLRRELVPGAGPQAWNGGGGAAGMCAHVAYICENTLGSLTNGHVGKLQIGRMSITNC